MGGVTGPMRRKLHSAPEHWTNLTLDGSTIDALRRRGLVELRSRQGESGPLAGYQWRITDEGREEDGRSPSERFADDPLTTVVVDEHS